MFEFKIWNNNYRKIKHVPQQRRVLLKRVRKRAGITYTITQERSREFKIDKPSKSDWDFYEKQMAYNTEKILKQAVNIAVHKFM